MVPFTSLPDSTVSKPPLKAENWAVQPFRLGVGAPKVDGHQIGSPLLSRSCACWLPSASLSPDESTITTFVPLGTPDKLLDEGAVRVGVVVPPSASAGVVKTALIMKTNRVISERRDNDGRWFIPNSFLR